MGFNTTLLTVGGSISIKTKLRTAAGGDEKQEAAAGGGYEEGEEEEAWPAASFGQYRTRVELLENVDMERIGVEVRDGVLYLTIPKLTAGGKVVNIQVQCSEVTSSASGF